MKKPWVFVIAALLGGFPVFAQDGCIKGDVDWIRKVCLHTSLNSGISTANYNHGILGATTEWEELTVFYGPAGQSKAVGQRGSNTVLELKHIYEDIAPRLADMDGDGHLEAIVIQSSNEKGARLVIYELIPEIRKLAATPYIGTRHRWLAPIGIADFNGDGDMDIAYIDRPHLAKKLRIVSYRDGKLVEIAKARNLSNHKIGWNFIAGGVRNCGAGPEMITADGAWRNVIATRFKDGKLVSEKIGTYNGPNSLKATLDC